LKADGAGTRSNEKASLSKSNDLCDFGGSSEIDVVSTCSTCTGLAIGRIGQWELGFGAFRGVLPTSAAATCSRALRRQLPACCRRIVGFALLSFLSQLLFWPHAAFRFPDIALTTIPQSALKLPTIVPVIAKLCEPVRSRFTLERRRTIPAVMFALPLPLTRLGLRTLTETWDRSCHR
jgi:hypothetical protein